jgi:integrase/recombinase XerC
MNNDKIILHQAQPLTLPDAPFDQFLAGQLSESTRKAYYADLCQFFNQLNFTDEDPSKITIETLKQINYQHVVAYRNSLVQNDYKRTTINRKLASLKAFFRLLVATGQIEQNPADSTLVRGFKQEHNPVGKAIPSVAIKAITDLIANDPDEEARARDLAMIHLLAFGGLRRSEAAAMRWENLRQEGPFFVLTLPETKSGVPQEIKLQAVAVHYLEEYQRLLHQRNMPTDSGVVFLSRSRNHSRDTGLSDHAINRIVKRRALEAGVKQNITAHMFRHTCCTLAIEGGAKPQQVQAHLRHKDLKTTMLYYENREKLTDNASDYIAIR